MKELTIEIIKFFKNNIIKILIGTITITILFVFLNTRKETDNSEDQDEEMEIELLETDANPANFKFFVEYEDGDIYSNNLLIQDYITMSKNLNIASSETNTDLNTIVERTDNKISLLNNEDQTMQVIGVSRNPDTHLQEFYVNVGNESDNLAIAEYFFNLIVNELPILQDKNIFIFKEPQLIDLEEDEGVEAVEIPEENPFGSNIIVGVFLGLILVTGLLILVSFFTKKLLYMFSYKIRDRDNVILIDKNMDYENELPNLLIGPNENNILVIEHEHNLLNDNLNNIVEELMLNKKINRVNSVFEIKDYKDTDRLIYIVEEGNTSREWYDKQRKYDRTYDISIIIIQINKNQQL